VWQLNDFFCNVYLGLCMLHILACIKILSLTKHCKAWDFCKKMTSETDTKNNREYSYGDLLSYRCHAPEATFQLSEVYVALSVSNVQMESGIWFLISSLPYWPVALQSTILQSSAKTNLRDKKSVHFKQKCQITDVTMSKVQY